MSKTITLVPIISFIAVEIDSNLDIETGKAAKQAVRKLQRALSLAKGSGIVNNLLSHAIVIGWGGITTTGNPTEYPVI